jgi:hypothetical protein
MLVTFGFYYPELKDSLKILGERYQDNIEDNLIPALSDYELSDYIQFITDYPLWMKYFIMNIVYDEGDVK